MSDRDLEKTERFKYFVRFPQPAVSCNMKLFQTSALSADSYLVARYQRQWASPSGNGDVNVALDEWDNTLRLHVK